MLKETQEMLLDEQTCIQLLFAATRIQLCGVIGF